MGALTTATTTTSVSTSVSVNVSSAVAEASARGGAGGRGADKNVASPVRTYEGRRGYLHAVAVGGVVVVVYF